MQRGSTMTLGLPPFTKAVKWIIGAAAVCYLVRLILEIASRDGLILFLQSTQLVPTAAAHGQIWRLLTYGFIPGDLFALLFNLVIGVWMFGSQLEMDFGTRKFVEFYFWCLIGAGLFTTAAAYTRWFGVNPEFGIHDLSAPVTGIFLAYGMLYPNREIMLLLPPIGIRAKYLVGILIFISLAIALMSAARGGPAVIYSAPTFGGLLFAFLFVKFVPRGGLRHIFSERYYGTRNAYYRWKRRRAARKFEVYMRQHKREDFFDEHGNYKDPSQNKDKQNGDPHGGGWVN